MFFCKIVNLTIGYGYSIAFYDRHQRSFDIRLIVGAY